MKKTDMYLLGLVGGLGIASNDIYVSNLPQLSKLFTTHPWLTNLTLTGYFVATAVSSIIYALMPYKFSKRNLFVNSLLFFIFATLFISFASSSIQLVIGRIMQGMAFGIIQPCIISAIKEKSQGCVSSSMASYSLASEILSIVIPVIGAVSFTYVSWNSPFIFLAVLSAVFLYYAKDLVTPSKGEGRDDLSLPLNELKFYNDMNFHKFNLLSFLMNGIGWALIIISTYIFDDSLNHGYFYAFYGAVYVLGCYICEQQIINKQQIIAFFPLISLIIGLITLCGLIFDMKVVFSIGMLLFGHLSGIVYGPIFDCALKNARGKQINLASSLLVFTRLVSSGVYISLASYLFFKSSYLFFALMSFSFLCISMLLMFKPARHISYEG